MTSPRDGGRPLAIVVGAAVLWLAFCVLAIPGSAAWADPPPVVTTGSAVSVRDTSATLTGTVYPSGTTAVSFEYGTSTAYTVGTGSTDIQPGNGPVSFSATVSGLIPGTTYHFRAVATNRSSIVPVFGDDHTFVTPRPTVPRTPTVATGGTVGLGQTAATLTGTANASGSPTTGNFEYGTSTTYGSSTAATGIGSGNRRVGFQATLSGLAAGTTYHYRAVATNKTGTARGDDRTFTTSKPPVASTGRATAVNGPSATLIGTADPSGAETTVTFEYGSSTAYSGNTPAQSVGSGYGPVRFHATITGLVAGTTYHFRAVATNANGTSVGADHTFTAATATTPTATPTASITAPPTAAPTNTATAAGSSAASTTSGHAGLIWLLFGLIGVVAVGVILAAIRLRPPPGS